MKFRRRIGGVVLAAALALPAAATAQSVNVTRGIFEDQPYTLIYPGAMVATGGGADPLTINHPDAPLQCELTIMPTQTAGWTAQEALEAFDEEAASNDWAKVFAGFSITGSSVRPYQNGEALVYEGESEDSPMDVPITLVHAETVEANRGYLLDCFYATEVAGNARPLVDFIIANFSTRSDADCCIGAQPTEEPLVPTPQ
jgi:hypothetical protein